MEYLELSFLASVIRRNLLLSVLLLSFLSYAMTWNLGFDENKYSFNLIEDTIKKYYPFGIEYDSEWTQYMSFPGIEELGKLVVENIHSNKNYKERWLNFIKSIGKESGKKVSSNTFGQSPSFSAVVLLDTFEIKNYKISKSLYFSVSFLGPFYTVFGLDDVLLRDGRAGYSATIAVTVSPYKEYEKDFLLLRKTIEERFKDYKYVPFAIYSRTMDGLKVSEVQEGHTSLIYNALFDTTLTSAILDANVVRGEEDYGYEEWKIIRTPTTDDLEIMDALEKNKILTASTLQDLTLHKVWRFKSHVVLKHIGMVGMEAFEFLDLTDPSWAIVKTMEELIPSRKQYSSADNILRFLESCEIYFKIAGLTESELRLHMGLNMQIGEQRMEGEFLELIFEHYGKD
jgi:hypothetical protein